LQRRAHAPHPVLAPGDAGEQPRVSFRGPRHHLAARDIAQLRPRPRRGPRDRGERPRPPRGLRDPRLGLGRGRRGFGQAHPCAEARPVAAPRGAPAASGALGLRAAGGAARDALAPAGARSLCRVGRPQHHRSARRGLDPRGRSDLPARSGVRGVVPARCPSRGVARGARRARVGGLCRPAAAAAPRACGRRSARGAAGGEPLPCVLLSHGRPRGLCDGPHGHPARGDLRLSRGVGAGPCLGVLRTAQALGAGKPDHDRRGRRGALRRALARDEARGRGRARGDARGADRHRRGHPAGARRHDPIRRFPARTAGRTLAHPLARQRRAGARADRGGDALGCGAAGGGGGGSAGRLGRS